MAICGLRAQMFETACQRYAEEDYEAAARGYEALAAQGYTSVNLEYNWGNACFRSGQLGGAILHYERALRLDPSNADTRHNLEFARSRTVDKIDDAPVMFFVQWWRSLRDGLSTDGWAVLAAVLFTLTLAALACYFFARQLVVRKAGFGVALTSLLVSCLAFVMACQSRDWVQDSGEAIVMLQTVTLKSTPDDSGTDLFILHEGTKVVLKSELGAWREVCTADGNTGWLPVSAIEVI